MNFLADSAERIGDRKGRKKHAAKGEKTVCEKAYGERRTPYSLRRTLKRGKRDES
jgi:hypothetical protein